MTLSRSIVASAGLHALVFCCAVAFVRMAGGGGWQHEDSIVVSLIPSGAPMRTGTGARAIRKEPPPRVDKQMIQSLPVEQGDISLPVERAASPAPAQEPAAAPRDIPGNGAGAARVTNSSAGSGSGGPKGDVITAEQWAVITAAIERNKVYPRLARERAIQGTVRLRIEVSPSGAVKHLEVIKSSNAEILDDAAQELVYRSAPFPLVSGSFEIPVKYVLQ